MSAAAPESSRSAATSPARNRKLSGTGVIPVARHASSAIRNSGRLYSRMVTASPRRRPEVGEDAASAPASRTNRACTARRRGADSGGRAGHEPPPATDRRSVRASSGLRRSGGLRVVGQLGLPGVADLLGRPPAVVVECARTAGCAYRVRRSPPMPIACPVTPAAASDASQTMSEATSSGVPSAWSRRYSTGISPPAT